MPCIELSNSRRYGSDESVVARIVVAVWLTVIVAVHPEDVVEAGVALAEILAVGATLIDSIALHHGEPAASLGRVQDHEQPVFGCKSKNPIGPSEVRVVGRGQI